MLKLLSFGKSITVISAGFIDEKNLIIQLIVIVYSYRIHRTLYS